MEVLEEIEHRHNLGERQKEIQRDDQPKLPFEHYHMDLEVLHTLGHHYVVGNKLTASTCSSGISFTLISSALLCRF